MLVNIELLHVFLILANVIRMASSDCDWIKGDINRYDSRVQKYARSFPKDVPSSSAAARCESEDNKTCCPHAYPLVLYKSRLQLPFKYYVRRKANDTSTKTVATTCVCNDDEYCSYMYPDFPDSLEYYRIAIWPQFCYKKFFDNLMLNKNTSHLMFCDTNAECDGGKCFRGNTNDEVLEFKQMVNADLRKFVTRHGVCVQELEKKPEWRTRSADSQGVAPLPRTVCMDGMTVLATQPDCDKYETNCARHNGMCFRGKCCPQAVRKEVNMTFHSRYPYTTRMLCKSDGSLPDGIEFAYCNHHGHVVIIGNEIMHVMVVGSLLVECTKNSECDNGYCVKMPNKSFCSYKQLKTPINYSPLVVAMLSLGDICYAISFVFVCLWCYKSKFATWNWAKKLGGRVREMTGQRGEEA